jgi:DNA-directed RNA polymerase subunit omega
MIYPPMSSLLDKVDSRYTLVIMTAKRARMLTNGARKVTDYPSTKDVTLAIHEIKEGKVTYHRVQRQQPTHEHMVEEDLSESQE